MFTSFTSLEVLLGIGVFLLAAHELRGVLGARRDGRSTNVSRVITHGVMMLLLGVYFAFALSYYPLEASDAAIVSFDTPVVNWSYVVLGLLLMVIAGWEGVSLVRARSQRLTRNLSRLVSHSMMVVMLLAMMGLSSQRWGHSLDRLHASCSQDIPAPAVAD